MPRYEITLIRSLDQHARIIVEADNELTVNEYLKSVLYPLQKNRAAHATARLFLARLEWEDSGVDGSVEVGEIEACNS